MQVLQYLKQQQRVAAGVMDTVNECTRVWNGHNNRGIVI